MKPEVLSVHMFGKFTFTYADHEISCTSSRSKLIWNILAYLLCHRGEFISANELISVIWKQEKNDNPAGAMRTAIHRARTILSELTDDDSVQFLISQNGGYMWNPEIEMVIDTDEFDRLIESVNDGRDEINACIAALDLYQGKFLPMQDSEMWVMPLQAYYQNIYESLIDHIVPYYEQEQLYGKGIALCRKALTIDPYSEKIYQYLLRFLLAMGERQEVVRTYEEMSKLLLATFGVMPEPESRALYREALQPDNKQNSVLTPEEVMDQLSEHGDIDCALICDYDFFRMVYQTQARTIVRSGQVIHTALLTLKSRNKRKVSDKSLSLAMDNLEKHMSLALRKGDVITRCSASQFILMLQSANYENSCKVCQRFISSFEKKYPHSPVYVDYYVQPIAPSTSS